jgi:hypothetical protein
VGFLALKDVCLHREGVSAKYRHTPEIIFIGSSLFVDWTGYEANVTFGTRKKRWGM